MVDAYVRRDEPSVRGFALPLPPANRIKELEAELRKERIRVRETLSKLHRADMDALKAQAQRDGALGFAEQTKTELMASTELFKAELRHERAKLDAYERVVDAACDGRCLSAGSAWWRGLHGRSISDVSRYTRIADALDALAKEDAE